MEFKKIRLSKSEKVWLESVFKKDFQKFDVDLLKVELHKELSSDFEPEKIDWRIYKDQRLTLIGVWLLNPSSRIFEICTKVIETIKSEILQKTNEREFHIEVIADKIQEKVNKVGTAFLLAYDLGFFSGGSWMDKMWGFQNVHLSKEKPFDKFLIFKSLEQSIEDYYVSHNPRKRLVNSRENKKPELAIDIFTSNSNLI